MNAPRVWIVPVNFNGLADTRKCLHSLGKLATPASVIVVDNASTEDPTEILKAEFPWAHVIRNPANCGWSGGNNAGIRFAQEHGADFVILLNNDTTVHPDLVGKLVAAAEANPAYGVIGPIIRYMDEPDATMTDAVRFNRRGYPGFFEPAPVREQGSQVAETDIVNGCCMMVRKEVFDRIGLIDDRFFLIHEESDFCLRAREAGWKCGVLAEPLIWHKGSSSFDRSGRRWQRYYDTRNIGLLLSKHSQRPGSYAKYLRYAYHRWRLEREAGHADAADAVLEGLVDAATRRFGAYKPRRRWCVPVLRCLFETAGRVKPRAAKRDGASA